MKKIKFSWLSTVILLSLMVVFFLCYRLIASEKTPHNKESKATPVTAVAVQLADIPVFIDALGTVTPTRTVTVMTQIAGILDEVYFKEGQFVNKGQLIAHIDSRQIEAQLIQAKGTLKRDQAVLANDQLNLQRYQQLIKVGSITQQMLDTQLATVKADEGTVQADIGNIKNLEVQLSYCSIRSPVDGVIGLRLVDPGNYVTPGNTTGIAVVTQLEPATIIYAVPEDYRGQISDAIARGSVAVLAYNRDSKKLLTKGILIAVDNQVDTSTGTIKVKAEFPHSGNALFPNQFVNVRMQADTLKQVPIIPTTAIQRGSKGEFIFVVKEDNKVELRNVHVGPADGLNSVILNDGVKLNERVVTDGADKLNDGSRVRVIPL